MLKFLDQANNLLVKVTQAMIITTVHDVIPEHEGICVSFFTYVIRFKTISNTLVRNTKLVFLVSLEPNYIFIYGNVLTSIIAPIEFVYDMIH